MSANSSSSHWTLERDQDGIAWLTLDRHDASTNSLSRTVMEELDAKLDELTRSLPQGLVVTSGKASGFIAGADIKQFVGIQTPAEAYDMIRQGQQVLDKLAALPCPTVAAINGFALGGGLEVALACRYRVVADDASITLGFPEVQLGVHPGLGGTVRAVQLVGPIAAMDLMLTGRSLRPSKALEMRLVDRVVPTASLRTAAKELVQNGPAPRTMSFKDRILNASLLRPLLARKMRAQVAKRARADHYPAPYALIELWCRYGGSGADAYEAEAKSMSELLCTSTSRNLVRVFFLQERLKSAAKSADTAAKHVHVVGAGVMGGDIAAWCAARGLTVTLQDRGLEYVKPALDRAREFFDKRYPDQAKRDATMARLTADVEGQGIARADIIIEAIFENLDAKRELYSRIEPQMKAGALLATNTSSIVLEQLAEKLNKPDRLVGLHFFNPVSRMPLIEVIESEFANQDCVRAALAFTRQIDKLAIPCRSSPGFLVNRILMPYLSEAVRAVEEGVPLTLIDEAAESFGMPMGPIELADVVGLDVIMSVGKVFFTESAAPKTLLDLVDRKKFGKKSGGGFYTWSEGKPQKPPVSSHELPPDLQDRLILSLVNEAVAVLREHIVADVDLIDAGAIFGAGFAPFRGGPLQYARNRGLDVVIARLRELEQRYGERFQPDAGWDVLR